jgi:hypothetical protein
VAPALAQPGDGGGQRGSAPMASIETCAPPEVTSLMSPPARMVTSAPAVRAAGQGLLGHVHADHARPQRRGDHHGRQPDPAAPVARRPTRPAARGRPARRRGRRWRSGSPARAAATESTASGNADEVDVGPVERDELGVRAPVREARLALAVADLLVPGAALLAIAARAHERGRSRARPAPTRARPARPPRSRRRARARARAGSARMSGSWPIQPCQSSGTARSPRPGPPRRATAARGPGRSPPPAAARKPS